MTEGDERVTIVVTAAEAAVRSQLRALLDAAPGLAVVAEADAAESALREVSSQTPAVLVLDVDKSGDSASLDTIRTVAQRSPATRVVVLVTPENARFVRHALHAGAAGCVLGHTPDLVEAVRRAATRAHAPEPGPRPDNLTEREFEVLTLLALGHTNAEIGRPAAPVGAHRRSPPRAPATQAAPPEPRRARALRARPRPAPREPRTSPRDSRGVEPDGLSGPAPCRQPVPALRGRAGNPVLRHDATGARRCWKSSPTMAAARGASARSLAVSCPRS